MAIWLIVVLFGVAAPILSRGAESFAVDALSLVPGWKRRRGRDNGIFFYDQKGHSWVALLVYINAREYREPVVTTSVFVSFSLLAPEFFCCDQVRSKRSRFITLSHAFIKSFTNFSCESSQP